MYTNALSAWMTDLVEYGVDTIQRSVLLMDILRKRGNNYLDHLHQEQPPVLVFNYKMVMDGRAFQQPVNYALVHILDRRSEAEVDRRSSQKTQPAVAEERRIASKERRHKASIAETSPEATSRPIIIFDPRAGHGPGIGGSKKDSQIGMALDAGHPVYFLIFFTMPMPSQTLVDVRNAQIRFVERVCELHPHAPRPAIIGNCQGGWAAALVGAKSPDLVGPMVFNGSPLSYWAGVEGVNPLRYMGGLMGGVWINSLLSDIGNGYFDGANLVANFENLNPANTLWTKLYHVFANVDTEEHRFLNFEKWWGGYFLMTAEEIHTIVAGLFIGNKLERGEFRLDKDHFVDLKNNTNPVVLFASFGDNITPPQQAFNWIYKAYGSVDEIKRRQQVIVYILHSKIGHLGIFVSAKIARREHKEIIASFDMLYHIKPGLYELRIEEISDDPGEFEVHYVEKSMEDILAFDDGFDDEKPFLAVRNVSEIMDGFYRTLISPWVRMLNNPFAAETLRQLHPLRAQHRFFSDLNPGMLLFRDWASQIKEDGLRRPVGEYNLFHLWEETASKIITEGLNWYRDTRDTMWELMFKAAYDNPWIQIAQV